MHRGDCLSIYNNQFYLFIYFLFSSANAIWPVWQQFFFHWIYVRSSSRQRDKQRIGTMPKAKNAIFLFVSVSWIMCMKYRIYATIHTVFSLAFNFGQQNEKHVSLVYYQTVDKTWLPLFFGFVFRCTCILLSVST